MATSSTCFALPARVETGRNNSLFFQYRPDSGYVSIWARRGPEWSPPRLRSHARNKASVESETILLLIAVIIVAIAFDAANWSVSLREMLFWMVLTAYFSAVLSPDRTFCDQTEVWLQVLMGWLVAAAIMLVIGVPVWQHFLSPLVGCFIAILANTVQRAMWDHF